MHFQSTFLNPALVLLSTACLLAGCGQAEPDAAANGNQAAGEAQAAEAQDLHDVPLTEEEKTQLRADNESYADAVAHIQSYRDTIATETAGGNPAEAHRALDNLDLVLEWLPEIAQNSGVAKTSWEEVNTTAQQLRDLFNAVHANIDDGKDPDYGSVTADIDKGVESLTAIKPEPSD